MSRILDRFYRVDASCRHSGDAAGLGLAITRSILRSHGGDIEGRGKEATSSRCGYRCRLAAIPEVADVPADHDLLWWWSSSKHDFHLEATNHRLKELELRTLQVAVSVSDPDTVTALFAQFMKCAYYRRNVG